MVYPLHIVFDPALRDFTDKISPGPLHLAFFAVKSVISRDDVSSNTTFEVEPILKPSYPFRFCVGRI